VTRRPLRLLLLAPTGFFADYGCHVRIRGQAEALSRAGHSVLICTYPGGREIPELETARPPLWPRGREMPVGSSWLKIVLDAFLTPTALLSAARFKPDLIHAYLHEGALLGRLLAGLFRVPLVFDYQGSLSAEMLDHGFLSRTSPFLAPLRNLEQRSDLWPDAVLASSSHASSMLIREVGLPANRVFTLPDSVDHRLFRPKSPEDSGECARLRAALGIPAERRLIVYLGLLAEYQGTGLLLAAMRRLLDARADTERPHLLVMGFPSVDHYRQLAAELGLSRDVTFSGKIPFEEAPTYLRLGTVAAATKISATEGSGKLLNYMATALPVAAFDTPVHREYLQDHAVYASPGDVDGLARAMAGLLDDPTKASRQGNELRQSAISQYSWDAACTTIENVHHTLLQEGR